MRIGLVLSCALLVVACSKNDAVPGNQAQAEQELEQARQSNQELKRLQAENQELARLRKDNAEVQRLQKETENLPQLREENEQLRAKLQSLKAPKPR